MSAPRTDSARLTLAVLTLAAIACSETSRLPTSVPSTIAPAQVVFGDLMEDSDAEGTLSYAVAATKFVDQAYATRSSAQKLDLYLPTTGTKPFPVVLWIHGGGWQSGTKYLSSTAAQLALVAQGYAIASVNYRLSWEAKFPAQIQDVKASVRWLRANAKRFNLDTARVGAWGASAGGHLAALLGTSNGVLALTDPTLGNASMSERVKAVTDFYGPVSFRSMDAQLALDGCPLYNGIGFASPRSPTSLLLGAAINTVPAKVAAADPITYLGAGDPPFFIQQGSADCTVPYQQSTTLRDAIITKVGASKVTYQQMQGYVHSDRRFMSSSNVLKVINFFKSSL